MRFTAKIWIEPYDNQSVPIEYWGESPSRPGISTLVPKRILMVNVASFTFQFISRRQVEDCLNYYQRTTHPSSRLPVGAMDHWEAQRWFERLPMYLLEAPKKTKVVKALKQALLIAESSSFG